MAEAPRPGPAVDAPDVLIVSLGSTTGLRVADEQLRDSLARAGARVEIARAIAPAPTRTLMLTDLAWARAARAATLEALAAHGARASQRTPAARGASRSPAIVYSSTTAALLWPRPGAIRFDAPSAGNRPGRHGLWQRPLEPRRLARAPLLLPWSAGGLAEAPASARGGDRALVVPVYVEPSGPPEPVRDIAAITYAANPAKKGLDRVLAAWRRVRGEVTANAGVATKAGQGAYAAQGELVVAGATPQELEKAGLSPGEDGVRVVGPLPHDEYRVLLRRSRVFVCAPRREDYGIAQLEALADGCLLVSTPAPGPYAALPIARALDARLVSDDLAGALRVALAESPAGYAARAFRALAPFTQGAVDRVVVDELLPLLAHALG
jgi:hypothetical protein